MIAARQFIRFDEYLSLEAETGIKHEFYDGEVFAMAGGTPNHSTLQFNVSGFLHAQLRGRQCKGFGSDQRVAIDSAGLYTYPDLSVACGAEFDEHNSLLNPTLLVEVLSPATEAYDRGLKFSLYQQLPSLRQYLLISQDQLLIHLFTRGENGRWSFEEFRHAEDMVPLTSIDCTLNVGELYEGVTLSKPSLHPGVMPVRPLTAS